MVLMLLACTDLPTESHLDRTRILAAKAEPAQPEPGELVQLSSLAFAPSGTPDVVWTLGDEVVGTEPVDVVAVPAMGPLRFTLEGIPPQGKDIETTTFTLEDELGNTNPVVRGVTADDVEVDGVLTLKKDETLTLRADVEDDEEVDLWWYTDLPPPEEGGPGGPDGRLFGDGSYELSATRKGEWVLYVVARDGRGGSDWATVPVEVH